MGDRSHPAVGPQPPFRACPTSPMLSFQFVKWGCKETRPFIIPQSWYFVHPVSLPRLLLIASVSGSEPQCRTNEFPTDYNGDSHIRVSSQTYLSYYTKTAFLPVLVRLYTDPSAVGGSSALKIDLIQPIKIINIIRVFCTNSWLKMNVIPSLSQRRKCTGGSHLQYQVLPYKIRIQVYSKMYCLKP